MGANRLLFFLVSALGDPQAGRSCRTGRWLQAATVRKWGMSI